jgi:hypothetical protein
MFNRYYPILKTFLVLFLVTIFTTSCKPWVKPYQRAKLADEIMSFDRDPVSDGYMHHVRQSRESARGAEGSGGGGCGCN